MVSVCWDDVLMHMWCRSDTIPRQPMKIPEVTAEGSGGGEGRDHMIKGKFSSALTEAKGNLCCVVGLCKSHTCMRNKIQIPWQVNQHAYMYFIFVLGCLGEVQF